MAIGTRAGVGEGVRVEEPRAVRLHRLVVPLVLALHVHVQVFESTGGRQGCVRTPRDAYRCVRALCKASVRRKRSTEDELGGERDALGSAWKRALRKGVSLAFKCN